MTRKPPPPAPRVWPAVPKLCPGGTVVILAGGPSLTRADVDYVRDKADAVIAINNAYALAPWATALYAADGRWWKWHWKHGAGQFPGLKYSLTIAAEQFPGVQVLRNAGREGVETEPTGLKNGRNSAYQAVNLAIHFGAKRILLLGVDMQQGPKGEEHWHPDHPNRSRSPYPYFIKLFQTLVNPLQDLGVDVINCSRRTALTCFPIVPLEEALPPRQVTEIAC